MPRNQEITTIITQDIQQRALLPGDRYLAARDVAKMLGVSTMTANRAMQTLAERGVLVRKQRAGTFVGKKLPSGNGPGTGCIEILVCSSFPMQGVASPNLNEAIEGLQREFPHEAVQFTYVPPTDELRFVRSLVETLGAGGLLRGVILILSTPAIQHFFAHANVPAVVWGSVNPQVQGLPWLDLDWRMSGKMLTQYLLEQGRTRITLLTRDTWAYGDNLLLDGIQSALSRKGKGHEALNVRSLHLTPAIVKHTVKALLAGKDAPTGFICRNVLVGEWTAEAIIETGLRPQEDVLLTIAEHVPPQKNSLNCVHVIAALDVQEQGQMLAQMLADLVHKRTPEPDHHLIPVQLAVPTEQLPA